MEKSNHHISAKRKTSLPGLLRNTKRLQGNSYKKHPAERNILKKIFHPDYILFDWEYFSHELEFE